MKKFPKILFAGAVTLALGSGAAFSYLQVQPAEQLSDLTLDNIEVMGVACQEGISISDQIITVTVCDRSTGFWDAVFDTPCGSPGDGACSFTNVGKA